MTVSKEEFGMWKQHEVTKLIFDALRLEVTNVEAEILRDDVLRSPDVAVSVAHLSGLREGINLLLNLQVEDISYETEQSESAGL